jgi:hypothetical protein
LTEHMPPEHGGSASTPIPKPLGGEVVGLEEGRIRIRLETGAIGFLLAVDPSQGLNAFHVGQRGTFLSERLDDQGETVLSLVSISDPEAPLSFEDDVDRLQDAINQPHAPLPARDEGIIPTMDEQRIQQWLDRTGKSLEKLRRNRAKRLDEEFYSRT